MKLVVSDPKTRKAYTKTIDNASMFIGKKIGNEVELGIIGLEGYSAIITGGSDKQGFPMQKGLEGGARKKVLKIVEPKNGLKKKVSRRGSLVSEEIQQLNLKVVKYGQKPLEEILGGENKEKPKEKTSAKPK
ncbi:MAG: S6e family ribosomal protein [Candidatus Diapherotrites archaeon]